MRILTIHNSYQVRGGEDESCDAEDSLLAESGHEVRRIAFDNAAINGFNAVAAGIRATWSRPAYSRVCRELDAWKPHVVNVQNFFPVASPSVHYAAARAGAAVVQTLHNYRLLGKADTVAGSYSSMLQGQLFRDSGGGDYVRRAQCAGDLAEGRVAVCCAY
jgi:hypothetical protein